MLHCWVTAQSMIIYSGGSLRSAQPRLGGRATKEERASVRRRFVAGHLLIA